MELGQIVKQQRESRGLTQDEFGQLAGGYSGSYISRIEKGTNKGTSKKTIEHLAKALKMSPVELNSLLYPPKQTIYLESIPPKTPDEIIKELDIALPAVIRIYRNLNDKQEVGYTFVPKPEIKGGIKVQGIISDRDFEDIHKGDTLLVSKSIKPKEGDICIYEKDGKMALENFNDEVDTENCWTVIKSVHTFRELQQ